MSRLLPQGLAGRIALLLAAALIAANLVAAALLTLERGRLEARARQDREVERIVSLVPALEAVAPLRRRVIARNASTRSTRVAVTPEPAIVNSPDAPRSQSLAEALAEALPGRELHAAVFVRRAADRPRWWHSDEDAPRGEGWQVRETIAVSIRLRREDAGPPQWLNVVARDLRGAPRGVEREVFLLVLALSLVAVLGVGLLFVRRLTRPLAALARAARAAGDGDRAARVPETGPRELRDAAAAFNDMQARIARFDAERMRTLAAVGHDLRTPITSLRIRAEMLDEDEAAPMIRTLDEMTVMADGLIAYARGSGEGEAESRIDLAALLTELCEDRGARLSATPPTADVTGRPVALKRALGNVIDNAIRYGGGAEVSAAVEGRVATIRISDTGPGIPKERLARVFDPFVRGEDSRSPDTGGAGLGLSIAQTILRAHGGSIGLENRAEGGLLARIRLPLAAA